MTENAIVLENVTKSFDLNKHGLAIHWQKIDKGEKKNDRLIALDNITLTIPKGEMVGIIGLNGSGKTTLLKIIAGIYPPDSGTVRRNGLMAPLLQLGTGFHNELVASENVIMYGMLLGMTKSQIKHKVDEIIQFAELERFSNLKLKHYSTGMRARLAFATAIQVDPDILLVDEVLSVGDAAFKEKSFKSFLSFKERKKTILYTTHNIEMISELSDKVLLLHQGKMIMVGDPKEAINAYREITKFSRRPN